jgi:16S rRNA (guanine527-N7)-methyltransferase
MTVEHLLHRGAAELGLPLEPAVRQQFDRYRRLLAAWGQKMNLTAVRDPEQVVIRHFLDSLALVRRLPTLLELPAPTLVDVGSGAGLPGAVCALLRPELAVTLVERVNKKAAFLLTLRRELGLRYEVFADDAVKLRSQFGIVVSRAALPLPRWVALGSQLVAPGGVVLAMTSLSEPLPPLPPTLRLTADETYDVGAGPHRLLRYAASGH